jgi:hypothetical protein
MWGNLLHKDKDKCCTFSTSKNVLWSSINDNNKKEYLGECREGMVVGIQEKIQYNDRNNNRYFIQQH